MYHAQRQRWIRTKGKTPLRAEVRATLVLRVLLCPLIVPGLLSRSAWIRDGGGLQHSWHISIPLRLATYRPEEANRNAVKRNPKYHLLFAVQPSAKTNGWKRLWFN